MIWCGANKYFSYYISSLCFFINKLSTKLCHKKSISGAVLIFLIVIQCLSGIMISFSFFPDSMTTPQSRHVEDMGDLYTDDFFWVHERLVDLIFLAMYFHMYKKLSFVDMKKEQLKAWFSGANLWFFMHVSIFLGLSLCCTHLSDLTLTIAANILYTLTMKVGKFYWVLFTDQTLNVDTVIRLSYLHYVVSLFILMLSFLHAFEMHHDWKNYNFESGVHINMSWVFFTLKYEISFLFEYFFAIYTFSFFFYSINEILSYEIFAWGDVGLNLDVRFVGVAPHWYFRAYMAWLIVCPHHYFGIFGLVYYIVIIYYQPYIKNYYFGENMKNQHMLLNNKSVDLFSRGLNTMMFLSLLYAASILPYGKFYNRLYGNFATLFTFFFIFFYLSSDSKKFLFFVNKIISNLIFKAI